MEFRELKSLSLLAATASITETARQMNLTPAAVHKQLKQLESELGVALYEKRDGQLKLTAAADVLLPYFRDMLSQYDSSMAALEEWKGARRGLIRIGSGPSLANYILPAALNEFHAVCPGVDVDVQTGNSTQLIELLKNGDLDIVLVVGRESAEDRSIGLALELRFDIPLITAMPQIPNECLLRDLKDVPFILFRRGARIENLIDEYLASHDLSPNAVMRFDSAEAIKAAILSGMGVAMLPAYSVVRELEAGTLRSIRHGGTPLTMVTRLLVRNQRVVPPAVNAFLGIMRTRHKSGRRVKRRTVVSNLAGRKIENT